MGARSSKNTAQNNRSDGHLLEYFRNTFVRGGGASLLIPPPPLALEIFLLAGGGGGGATAAGYAGGGGGSGGAVYFSSYVISSPTTLSITVGGGGAGGGTNGGTGTPSTVTDPTGPYVITADGGGGGVGYAPYRVGNPGGSGGGSESPAGNLPGAPGTKGSVTGSPPGSSYVLYGEPGGPITPVNGGCSGGGGLGAAGSTPVLGEPGPTPDKYRGSPGGIGLTLPQFLGPLIGITPISPYSGRYGGGGGAGSVGNDGSVYGGNDPNNPLPGNASPYGGGIGGRFGPPGVAGTPGIQYLGGGGGGGAPYLAPGGKTGGAGGAGICIIRFEITSPYSATASGSLATPTSGLTPGNGYRYFTFTGSGSLAVTA